MNPASFFRLLWLLTTVTFTSVSLLAQNMQSLPIMVQKDRQYQGHLFGIRQDIWVYGTVKGDVSAVGADIHVFGNIEGNLSLIDGTLVLYRDAQISGNLVCLGAHLQRHAAAKVGGRLVELFTPKAPPTHPPRSLRTAFDFALALFVYLLAIFTFYVFPNQVNEASFQLSQDWVRPLIVGAVVLALLCILLLISFMLMVVLIGLPLLLLVICTAMVIGTFGGVIVMHRLSDWIRTHLPSASSLALTFFLSGLILVLSLRIPYLGVAVAIMVLLWGTGIAIDTRFGTEKHWFTGRQRYW